MTRSNIELGDVTPHNIKQLKKLNTVVFPVSYNEKFYIDVLEAGELAKLVYYNDIVVGAVCCRIDTSENQRCLYIMTLVCLSSYLRLGIGTVMFQHILNFAEKDGAGATAVAPRKRGRKAKDPLANETKVDVKVFQNGSTPTTGAAACAVTSATTTGSTPASAVPSSGTGGGGGGALMHTAARMLGNQLNPNSNVAQKLTDQLHMEIQDHSIYTADAVTPQFVGVPFPGKTTQRNTTTTPNVTSNSMSGSNSANTITAGAEIGGGTSLASMFGSDVNGNMAIPQSLEQLLERQWEQGSQFLMEQAQHFDIASLLSCLHQLQRENVRLEEHVTSLIARRDHLLAVNARLAVPLKTNTTQSQGK